MRRLVFLTIATIGSILFQGCKSTPHPALQGETMFFMQEDRGPPPRALPTDLKFPFVTRAECIAIAEAYLKHEWVGSEANQFHGLDSDSIRVDTPDISFRPPGIIPGWWASGLTNRGIPYQWGGFSSLEEFDKGIADGKYAGDIFTPQKRTLLDDAVSRHAVGIDCSGFVSKCWKLPRSFSTRELPSLCVPLASWDELQSGDILNTHNNHVLIFDRWINPQRTLFASYDTGSPPTWKVQHHGLKRAQITAMGYLPWRYRNMR